MTAHQKLGFEPALERLATILELSRKARKAADAAELEFLLVNDTHHLTPYRQAALWSADHGIIALSGLVDVEANAPYAQWVSSLCKSLATTRPTADGLTANEVDPVIAADWREWFADFAGWFPLEVDKREVRLALVLGRDFDWSDREILLMAEWLEAWHYAYAAQSRGRRPPLRARVAAFLRPSRPDLKWHQQKRVRIAGAVLLLLLLPVRLSVLAPGELVPNQPATLRAANDGVIDTLFVRPNEQVRPGQPLFRIDTALSASRRDAALEALAAAEAEYRQTMQRALFDDTAKSQLAVIAGKLEGQRAEAEYLEEQVRRSTTIAPRAGIVLFDDPGELVGRPVVTGERVMRIASPSDAEVEAWVNIGDAIPLRAGADVKLYLDARPLAPVEAKLRYFSHEAVERPDGSYAYRIRARIVGADGNRIGLKGTAKLYGGWVPLTYWMLRRPLAAIRSTIGV
jgi:multidrug resistance efflux pump